MNNNFLKKSKIKLHRLTMKGGLLFCTSELFKTRSKSGGFLAFGDNPKCTGKKKKPS